MIAALVPLALAVLVNLAAAPVVDVDAIEKETALLRAERDALHGTRASIAEEKRAQVERLEAEIGALQETATSLSRHTAVSAVAVEDGQRLRATLDDTALKAKLLEDARRSLQRPAATLADAFSAAYAKLDDSAHVHVEDAMFFDVDGSLVNGKVVRWGALAALGSSAQSAGPLARVSGALERVPVSASSEKSARAAVEKVGATDAPAGVVPLFLGAAPGVACVGADCAASPGSTKDAAGFFASTARGGLAAWIALVLGAVALLVAARRLVRLSVEVHRTRKLGRTVPALVRTLELTRAVAQCKRTGGSAAEVLAEIVRSTTRVHAGALEDRAIDLVLEENARSERALSAAALAAGASLSLGAYAFVSSFATGPGADCTVGAIVLTHAMVFAIPAALACGIGAIVRGALRNDLEGAALHIIAAARTAGTAGSTEAQA